MGRGANLVELAGSMQNLNFLTNPCIDAPTKDGTCGWVVGATGSRVPNSNVRATFT